MMHSKRIFKILVSTVIIGFVAVKCSQHNARIDELDKNNALFNAQKQAEISKYRDKIQYFISHNPHMDWKRHPDGRVVIELLNQQFAFTTTPRDLEIIGFSVQPEELETLFKRPDQASLDGVINNPDYARAVFSLADEVEIWVAPDRPHYEAASRFETLITPHIAQGKFDVTKLARGGGNRTFKIWVYSPALHHDNHRDLLAPPCDASNFSVLMQKDAYGFFVSEGPKDLPTKRYCLPAANRSFKTPNDLRIQCVEAGWFPDPTCTAWFFGKNLEVGYGFQQPSFPESDWRNLDGRMHDYYSNFILTNKIE